MGLEGLNAESAKGSCLLTSALLLHGKDETHHEYTLVQGRAV